MIELQNFKCNFKGILRVLRAFLGVLRAFLSVLPVFLNHFKEFYVINIRALVIIIRMMPSYKNNLISANKTRKRCFISKEREKLYLLSLLRCTVFDY